jgi:hypothetical protein
VNTSEFVGGNITATVEVEGLPSRCPKLASCTTTVIRDPVARRIDEYGGDISFSDEKARLDRLISELRKDPHALGYILSYAGRAARRGEALRRAERARRYVIKEGGFDPRMLVAIDGGHRESRAIELYIVPSGISPPAASPTVEPSEVNERGRRRKRAAKP